MNKQLISLGTITFAMKGRELLMSHGIKAYIERTPKQSGGYGCGYSLYVPNRLDDAITILKKSGINVIDVIGRGEHRDLP